MSEINITNNELLVFVDDTGHETFAGNQGYYGLGGCVVLGEHYERLKSLWREVRLSINGSPDTPLHASELPQTASNFDALNNFFLDPSFLRIAVTTTKNLCLPGDMLPVVPVMGKLDEEIEFIAGVVPCTGVSIIFESSQRADPILRQRYGELGSVGEGIKVPVQHCLMSKSSKELGLEIADFIIGAAGSQTQRYLRQQPGMAKDFFNVFGRLPSVGCRFSLIRTVGYDTESDLVLVDHLRLCDGFGSIGGL